MRTLYAGLFVSLDGVAESPNLFVFPYFDAAVGAEVGAGMARTDTVLLGRKLYGEWAAHWPGKTAADDPYAEFINPVRKVVLSTTLDEVTWEHSELVREDHEEAVRRLKAEDGGDIAVNGSITVAQTMLRAGLLDELRLLWCSPWWWAKAGGCWTDSTESRSASSSARRCRQACCPSRTRWTTPPRRPADLKHRRPRLRRPASPE